MAETPGSQEALSPVKRALLEVRALRARLDAVEQARSEPIAVVGMGLRFPGEASSPDRFWDLLKEGRDVVSEVPRDRWDLDAYFDPDPDAPGKMYTRHGGFLGNVDRFDPAFFGISPREADTMDPQQRLLLEVSWEALEHAGQAPDRLRGSKTGVYWGIAGSDYFRQLAALPPSTIDAYFATGNAFSVAAGRISYLLGLQGPSIALDTACSSSLVAVHLAIQSLRGGEIRMALAGGVNLILAPEININFSKARMMAPDGRCKTFAAAADGYVRGEGCGAVILKRLSDALADGDRVLAVIRGSAVNQDGRSGGLTAPNGPSQEDVLREALANGGVDAGAVGYVEAHGTGTPLGDPIEVQALGNVFGKDRPKDRPLTIGSVKTNMGHLEAAAGVASLIKVVLMLQHRAVPAHLHFEEPSPHIPWDRFPLRVPTAFAEWASDNPRVAGVSSFGFSGTNAHVILEEAPHPEPAEPSARPLHLLCLSAKTETALAELATRYADYFEAHPDVDLADVCYSANTGRAHLEYRLAVPAETSETMQDRLRRFAAGTPPEDVYAGWTVVGAEPVDVAFLFPGQGPQYPDMGRALYETQPAFRAAVDRCEAALTPMLDRSMKSVLFPAPGDEGLIHETVYTQPAMFVLQYALAEMWKSWGIVPSAVMGHSLGEFAAACVAGVFNLEDGLKLVVERGRLMASLPGQGLMASLLAPEARVRAAMAPYADRVSFAAINGPESVVISGFTDAVEAVLGPLEADGVKVKRLAVSFAGHSPQVDPSLNAFERTAAEVTYHAPTLDLISNLTGRRAKPSDVTNAVYWRRHVREPVRFFEGLQALHELGCRVFVEIGPHTTLMGLGQAGLADAAAAWLPSLRQGWPDWQQVLESLGRLFVRGVEIDWAAFDGASRRRRVALPSYPFERTSHWFSRSRAEITDRPARWATVTDEGRRQAAQVPIDLEVSRYPAKWEVLNRLAYAYIARALTALGVFSKPGERHTVSSLLAACGINDVYDHLLDRWLGHLAGAGWLQRDEDTYVSQQPLPDPDLDAARAAALEAFAGEELLADYLIRCGERLADVVTGRLSALDTLFPGGSYETTEYIYQKWAVPRYFNGIARAVARAAADTRAPGEPLRVIEIGSGTGGTTSALLPQLRAYPVDYYFTDVSDYFLERGKETFAAYPFVRYRLLNIENDPAEQGFPRESFDLVVAANVLHATRHLDETLRHARSLLLPGGVLMLYETTLQQDWFDVTTGLIEGWQAFEDNYRSDHPLLDTATWKEALLKAGFADVEVLPGEGVPTEILYQHVIVARVPGEAGRAADAAFFEATQAEALSGPSGATQPTVSGAEAFRAELMDAVPADREALLVDFVRQRVASVLRRPSVDSVAPQHRLLDLGMDSLMAVELRNRLSTDLGVEQDRIPATLIFDYPTVQAIATRLLEAIGAADAPADAGRTEAAAENAAENAEAARIAQIRADIEHRTDEEMEALLMDKLDHLLGSSGSDTKK